MYDRLRDPAHTGERRCWPCTVANVVLLALASLAVARRRSRAVALSLAAGGAVAIALRGYLVPYTPRFAPRLAARLPWNPFHSPDDSPDLTRPSRAETAPNARTAPESPGSLGDRTGDDGNTDQTDDDAERVVAALVENGVVESEGETIYLADDFREAWRARMEDLRERDAAGLADALRAVTPEGTEIEVVEQEGPVAESQSDRWFVVSDGSGDPARESWLTRPVAVAEAAAVGTLGDRTDADPGLRAAAAGPLRTFLERCPVCDGPVERTTTVDCCGGPGGASADAPDEVLACGECSERLYTFQ